MWKNCKTKEQLAKLDVADPKMPNKYTFLKQFNAFQKCIMCDVFETPRAYAKNLQICTNKLAEAKYFIG